MCVAISVAKGVDDIWIMRRFLLAKAIGQQIVVRKNKNFLQCCEFAGCILNMLRQLHNILFSIFDNHVC